MTVDKPVQALGMALETIERERTGTPAPFALCPRCATPLICTLAWAKYEFYCVNCGAHLDWLDPRQGEPTPDLQQRYDATHAEWVNLGGENLIGGGTMLTTCPTCKSTGEPHIRHATVAEVAAHKTALEKLDARANQRTIREVREHALEHRAADTCDWCALWAAFARGDLAAIDAIIERAGNDAVPDDLPADLLERARRINWGEAVWTASDL